MRITCSDDKSYRQLLEILGVADPFLGALESKSWSVEHGGVSITVELVEPPRSFLSQG